MDQKSFRALQKKWYKKLEDEGFKDIERARHKHLNDKDNTWYFESNYTPETFEAETRYFQLAGQLLHSYPFRSKQERIIWQMHAEGRKLREIQEYIKKDMSLISRTITRIAKCIKA